MQTASLQFETQMYASTNMYLICQAFAVQTKYHSILHHIEAGLHGHHLDDNIA